MRPLSVRRGFPRGGTGGGRHVRHPARPAGRGSEGCWSVRDGQRPHHQGERKPDHDTAGKDYFVREVAYGTFQRDFALPEGVDAAHVEAKYANGMLQVRVPRRALRRRE